jgi:hypothetical protein
MSTQIPKNPSANFERGFVDGYSERALRFSLETASGRFLSDAESKAAVDKLKDLPLSEIARRVLASHAVAVGAGRLAAILKGGVS